MPSEGKKDNFVSGVEKPEPIIDMVAFRNEVGNLTAEQQYGPKTLETGNHPSASQNELLRINPNELTEEDALMWKKVKNYTPGSITLTIL